MTNQTLIYKDSCGNWQAKSTEKTTINNKPAHLDLATHKYGKRLSTFVSVCWPSEDGRSTSSTLFEDFTLRVEVSTPARVTSKVLEDQHAKHKARMSEYLEAAKNFYKNKV